MVALSREELRGKEHPSTSRLIAYQRGEISTTELAAITEHLSLCKDCAALVLDAAEFFADDDEEEVAPADLETSWQELRAAMSGEATFAPSPATFTPPPSIPKRSLFRSLTFAYSLAAMFAAVSFGLVVFQRANPPSQPQVNVGLYDLTPSSSERGEEGQATPIRFQASESSAFLILNPAVVTNSAHYGVRIRGGDGHVIWRSESLRLQAPGGFHLSLPADALPLGRYSLELYGIQAGQETPLGTYLIEIKE
jgi:hypothetical protein